MCVSHIEHSNSSRAIPLPPEWIRSIHHKAQQIAFLISTILVSPSLPSIQLVFSKLGEKMAKKIQFNTMVIKHSCFWICRSILCNIILCACGIYACLCVCMCVLILSAGACAMVGGLHVWRMEVGVSCLPQMLSALFFCNRVSHCAWRSLIVWADWPVNSRTLLSLTVFLCLSL